LSLQFVLSCLHPRQRMACHCQPNDQSSTWLEWGKLCCKSLVRAGENCCVWAERLLSISPG